MPEPDVPHFAFPFRYRNGRAVLVEQGSAQEIEGNVELILSTVQGRRETQPEFGIPDQTFVQDPSMVADLVQICQFWEPRATVNAVVDGVERVRTTTVTARV